MFEEFSVSDQQLQNLIKMANQISVHNLHHGDEDAAADAVANHIRKFWARSMKDQLRAYAKEDGSELSAVSRAAAARI